MQFRTIRLEYVVWGLPARSRLEEDSGGLRDLTGIDKPNENSPFGYSCDNIEMHFSIP
jgi:hypothetical protein